MVRRAKALHAWDEASGATATDLHFTTGQEFDIISESVPGGGWYTGTIDGTEGIFPGNFVEVIEVPDFSNSSSPPAAVDVRTRARRAAPPIAPEVSPAATAEFANIDAPADEAATGGVSEESEPPPGAAPAAASALWHGQDKQQQAADAARARRAEKKHDGLMMELEEGAEDEDEEKEPVPMTPAERRAEWKLERQRTAEKAEAVAPADPMLQSTDSANETDNFEDSPEPSSAEKKREEWKRSRQAAAVQAEHLAPGSASPPPTRGKPERPKRSVDSDPLSLDNSQYRSDQGAGPPIGNRGAPSGGGRRRLSIAEFKDLMTDGRSVADDPASAAAAATRSMMLGNGERRGSVSTDDPASAAAAATRAMMLGNGERRGSEGVTQAADARGGGSRRRLSISQFKDLLSDPASSQTSPSFSRRGSVSSDGSERGRRKMSTEMTFPSPIPEREHTMGRSAMPESTEVDAALARLRTRRMSVQQSSTGMAAFKSVGAPPERAPSERSITSASSIAHANTRRPNAERVVLNGEEYQLESQQPGLQLFDAAGKRMVRQFQWGDIKSWSETPNSSLSINCADDSVFEFQIGLTGPICQAMKDHTEMLSSTRNRERADHEAAVARATRAEEQVIELQQQLGEVRSDLTRLTAELQAERKLTTDAQETVKQHAEDLAQLRANAHASSSELEQQASQLREEMRSQRGELDRASAELADAKRSHAAERDRATAALAAEQRAKSNLEGRIADVERAKSTLEERLIQVEENLSAEQRAKFTLEDAKGTLERRSAELQREIADVRQDLAQAVDARRAAEARCDDVTRSGRQAATTREEEHSSKLRAVQEQCDDAVAESTRLRREMADLEDSSARRVAKLMEEEAIKSAGAEKALREVTLRAEQATATARNQVEEQAEARCSRLRDEYELKLADAQRRVVEAEKLARDSASAESAQMSMQLAAQVDAAEARGKASVQQDLMLARSEASTLRQQLTRAESHVEETARRLSTTEAEIRQLRAQASELEVAAAGAKNSSAMVESRLAEVQGQLEEAQRALAASTSKERAARDELEQISSVAEESARSLAKMKAELASTRDDKEALEDASEADRRELRRLRLASSDAEEEASAAAARHRKELSAVEDRMSSEISALQDKLRSAQSELEAERSAARAAKDEVDRVQSRASSLRVELQQLQQEQRQQQLAAVAEAQAMAAAQVAGSPLGSRGMWVAPATMSSPHQFPQQQQQQHVASPQPAPPPATQSMPPPSSPRTGSGEERPGGIATEIRALAQLQDDAIISAEEFKKAKAGLLNPGRAAQLRPPTLSMQRANEEHEEIQAAATTPLPPTMAGRLAARRETRERRAQGYAATPLRMQGGAPLPAWGASYHHGGASAQLSQLSHYQSILAGDHGP